MRLFSDIAFSRILLLACPLFFTFLPGSCKCVYIFFSVLLPRLANSEVPWLMVRHSAKIMPWLCSPWFMMGIFVVNHSELKELHVLREHTKSQWYEIMIFLDP